MKNINSFLTIAAVLILIYCGFYIGKTSYKAEIIKTETVKDTVYLDKFIYIEKAKTTKDTVIKYITRTKTEKVFLKDTIEIKVAELDTTIINKKDTTKLLVKYYNYPLNKFDVFIKHNYPLIKEKITNNIEFKPKLKLLDKVHFGLGVGIDKNLKPNFVFGIFYKINLWR